MSGIYRLQAFHPYSFQCACCGHTVEVTEPTDKRERFCCHACEKKYWRDVTRHPDRITNYHSLEEYDRMSARWCE